MAPKAKRKSGLDSNAAYSASQPLFDTLRQGVEQLSKENNRLAVARDIVQNLHVKIVNETPHQNKSCHEQYLEKIVHAWLFTSKVYMDIFDHLETITAADPTEGRPASDNHEHFSAIHSSLLYSHLSAVSEYRDMRNKNAPAGAPKLADYCMPDNDDSEDQADAGGLSDGSDVEQEDDLSETSESQVSTSIRVINSNGKRLASKDNHQNRHTSQPPAGTQNGTTDEVRLPKRARTTDTRAGEGHAGEVTSNWNGIQRWLAGNEPPPSLAEQLNRTHQEQRRQERKSPRKQRKKARKSATRGAPAESENAAARSHPTSHVEAHGHSSPPVPEIQFEDVAAEASARLQVNEDAKSAKKQQKKKKKRKRESKDSNVNTESVFDDPLAALEASLAEKPGKKKQKLGDGTQKETVPETQTPRRNPKRKHVADGPADGGEPKKSHTRKKGK